jgi:hypothetical protein
MKPEGIEPFSDGDNRKVIIVDDDGGCAVVRLQ